MVHKPWKLTITEMKNHYLLAIASFSNHKVRYKQKEIVSITWDDIKKQARS